MAGTGCLRKECGIMKEHVTRAKEDQNPYEKCVLCHHTINVNVSEPVSCRMHYVEGAGQLCPACYARVYETWNHGQAGKKAAP